MNKKNFIGLVFAIVICFIFAACDTSAGGGDSDLQLADLQKYQNAGAAVAARTWTENYDCSNFSVQFYQNCSKAGLPCRVRAGKSGGSRFSVENHSWNSVKINGTWVNWEPQLNDVYTGHQQTRTPMGDGWSNFVAEDITRIVYENIGKYVPEHIIDQYEIDTYWNDKSPFYPYFISQSHCISDDKDMQDLVAYLQNEIPHDNSGDIFIDKDQHLFFFFKYNNKYYGIENIDASDPVEGRSVITRDNLKEIINSNTEFTKLKIDFSYDELKEP
jgi:hypothetical protein